MALNTPTHADSKQLAQVSELKHVDVTYLCENKIKIDRRHLNRYSSAWTLIRLQNAFW